MGNAVSLQFQLGEQVGTAGPGSSWKVHSAVKRSTKQQCTVFVFQKTKEGGDRLYEILKRNIQELCRLRHPFILQVTEALDESRDALAFAAERVEYCLSDRQLDELEIQKGVLQLIQALEFLHANGIIHCALSPNSVFICQKGDWKLGGFCFAKRSKNAEIRQGFSAFSNVCNPDMDYLAPEIVEKDECCPESDIWSLGCLICFVFGGNSPVKSRQNTSYYSQVVKNLQLPSQIPLNLNLNLKSLFSLEPGLRNLQQLKNSEYFNNSLVKSMEFLENFVSKDQMEKIQFLKKLTSILGQFSERVLKTKVAFLLLEQLKDTEMTPFLLSNLFIIIEKQTNSEFEQILPQLRPVFLLKNPPQTPLLLLSRIELLICKCKSNEIVKKELLPMVIASITSTNSQIQEMGLTCLSKITLNLDLTSLNTQILPLAISVYQNSATVSVKISALHSIESLVKVVDKHLLQERILPLLLNRTREPQLLLSIVSLYERCAERLDDFLVANLVLPELWRLCLDPLFGHEQFELVESVINGLASRVLTNHRRKLGLGTRTATASVKDDAWSSALSATPIPITVAPSPITSINTNTLVATPTVAIAPNTIKYTKDLLIDFDPLNK